MNYFSQILLYTPTFLPKLKKFYKNKVEEKTLIYNLIELSKNPYDTKFLYQIKKNNIIKLSKIWPFFSK